MVKPYWDKEKGKYCVEAFGEIHEFDERLDADVYAQEVNDFWMQDYNYLEEL